MKDTFSEGNDPQTGDDGFEKTSRFLPRLGLGEKNLIPVAPGPCALEILGVISHFGKKLCLVFMVSLVLLCLNLTAEAVPDFHTDFAVEWSSCGVFDSDNVFVMNDFLLYRSPYRNNSGLSDVINVERIPAQDFKYKFLEDVLYKYLGGSYEPCSIGYPFRPERKRYIIIRVKDSVPKEGDGLAENAGNTGNQGDIYAGMVFSSGFLKNSSGCFTEPETIMLDIRVIPEPSSAVIFAGAALVFILTKKRLKSRLMRQAEQLS